MIDDVKANNYQKLSQQLVARVSKAKNIKSEDIDFDVEDAYILAREVWDWTCVMTGQKHHGLEFVQWDPEKPLNIRNVVLIKGELGAKHLELKSLKDAKYSSEIMQKVKDGFEKLEEKIKKRERVWVHRN